MTPFEQFSKDLRSDPEYRHAIKVGQKTGDYYAVTPDTVRDTARQLTQTQEIN